MDDSDRGEIGGSDESTNREDVAVNEVIEVGDSSDEESGLIEIETVQPDDMFAFCMDQIMNASTREERQEARDLFVDNFGEASLNKLGLEVIVDKGKQFRVDSELPSTSQVSHNSTQTRSKRKKSQKQLDYNRKYREQLKKNPVKYAKALENMRNYHKQRVEQMTPEEKKAYNQRKIKACRKYRQNLSTEKKRAMYQKNYQQQNCMSASNKFVCKFKDCGKSFIKNAELIKHERVHLDIEPFICTWPNCQHTAKSHSNVIRHVRTKHFKLPETKKAQELANIVDNRNPNDHIRVDAKLAKRRLE